MINALLCIAFFYSKQGSTSDFRLFSEGLARQDDVGVLPARLGILIDPPGDPLPFTFGRMKAATVAQVDDGRSRRDQTFGLQFRPW
jgi:hypothetical protein